MAYIVMAYTLAEIVAHSKLCQRAAIVCIGRQFPVPHRSPPILPHPCVCACMRVCVHASVRVCILLRACVRACARASVRACLRASERASERACVRACVRGDRVALKQILCSAVSAASLRSRLDTSETFTLSELLPSAVCGLPSDGAESPMVTAACRRKYFSEQPKAITI